MRHPLALTAALLTLVPFPALRGQAAPNIRGGTPLLRYDRIGSGPPLLLLHGFGGCARDWRLFDSTFRTKYQLIVPDLPGHGGSPRPAGPYTARNTAKEVIRLLDSLKITKVRAAGISAGGMALLHAAILRPELFDKVIIIGATSTFPPQAQAILRRTTALDSVPAPVRERWQECATGGPEQLGWLVRQFHGLADDPNDMNLGPADLQKIKARMLIVHGDRDIFFPVDIPAAIHLAVPNSALWIVPFEGHVPIADQWNRPFQQVAMEFFERP